MNIMSISFKHLKFLTYSEADWNSIFINTGTHTQKRDSCIDNPVANPNCQKSLNQAKKIPETSFFFVENSYFSPCVK